MNDQKKRKFKGSVLFTVVFVMSILIVLLFGTLTLAYATNSRAHVNYSSAQTGITSRLVTESAIRAISGNDDYAKAIASLDENNRGPMYVKVQMSSTDSSAALGTMGHGDDQHDIYTRIEYAGKKEYYDADEGSWLERNLLRFSSTVSQGGVEKTSTAYVIKHKLGANTGNTGGGAGFVTTAGATLSTQTSLLGGSYVNLPNMEKMNILNLDNAQQLEFYKRLSTNGARGFKKFDASNMNNTSLYLENTGGLIECDSFIYNNLVPHQWSEFHFPKEGTGLTVWGDLVADSATLKTVGFYAGQSFVDKYSEKNPDGTFKNSLDFNKIPYIYVNGGIYASNSSAAIVLGNISNPFPLNVFCGYIDSRNVGDKFATAADIYCMDEDKTSYFRPNTDNSTILYNWVGSVLTKTNSVDMSSKINSNIYSKGSVVLDGSAEGAKPLVIGEEYKKTEVRVDKNCTIRGNVTIYGDLVVNGTLIFESTPGAGVTTPKLEVTGKIYYRDSAGYVYSASNTNYVVKESIKHDGKMDLSNIGKIENAKRYYYRWDPKDHTEEIVHDEWNTEIKYLLPSGESTYADDIRYYAYYENYSPELLAEDDDPDNDAPEKWLNPDVYYNEWNRPENPVDKSKDYYYVRKYLAIENGDMSGITVDEFGNVVDAKFITNSVPQDEAFYYVDKTTLGEVEVYDEEEYYTRRALDDSDTGEITFEQYHYYVNGNLVSEEEAKRSATPEAHNISDYPNAETIENYAHKDEVYPKYAERGVLLGLETLDGIPEAQTKVVKTLKDIKSDVADPYQYDFDLNQIDKLPNSIKNAYLPIKNDSYVSSIYDSRLSYDSTTKVLTINSSCKLNLSVSNGSVSKLVINPGNEEQLLVVKNLSVDNPVPIEIVDTGSGHVNMLVEKGGKFEHAGNGTIATTTYLKKLNDMKTDKNGDGEISVGYNSKNSVVDFDLQAELGSKAKPNFNIYGEMSVTRPPEVTLTNVNMLTANILSPSIKFTCAGGTGGFASYYDHFYYDDIDLMSSDHGRDVAKNLIFGCLNAKEASIPNQFYVIYTTDDGGDIGGLDVSDSENWYRLLYYSEY